MSRPDQGDCGLEGCVTTHRRDGGAEETPFGKWVRAQDDLDSISQCLTVNDVDMMFHKYRIELDGIGPRKVQLMLDLEVKGFERMPSSDQRQTLFFHHQLLANKGPLLDSRNGGEASVWHFGFFVLSMRGLHPGEPNPCLKWWRFNEVGKLLSIPISVESLKEILRFDIRPDTLEPISLRRHHKTVEVEFSETTALGFEVPCVVKRSS